MNKILATLFVFITLYGCDEAPAVDTPHSVDIDFTISNCTELKLFENDVLVRTVKGATGTSFGVMAAPDIVTHPYNVVYRLTGTPVDANKTMRLSATISIEDQTKTLSNDNSGNDFLVFEFFVD